MNPDSFPTYEFNLATLLRLNDLSMRDFAEIHKKTTVREYFRLLSQFINFVPDVSDAIYRFADDDSHAMDWKLVKDIIPLFEKMSCERYLSDLVAIRSACERGDHRAAASHAVNIDQSLKNLYSHVVSAKMTKEGESFPEIDSPLLSYLKVLEKKKSDQKLLVLTVDDSPAILEAVSTVLGSDYAVFKLPKPTLLEKVLQQVTPNLFLLDYQMPERNGFELIPIIRGLEKHKNTPIIFLTSEGTVDNITAAIGLGACDFIVKPFNPDQLKEKVAKHIA
jgi:PleD family two-component response regulator